ncbi:MAG: oligoendopeptidase F, partial [Calditrichaeota bacterium]
MTRPDLFPTAASNAAGTTLPERSQIDARYRWRLEEIFPSDEAWEEACRHLETLMEALTEFPGTLGNSPEQLLACLKKRDAAEELLGKIYLYAGLSSDQDTRVPKYQAYRDRAGTLMTRLNEATAFIQPEILALPEETLRRFLEAHPGLAEYRHYLEDLLRRKPHILPPEQERLLAMAGEMAQAPYTIFSMFNNADITFPTIRDEQGNEVEVTKGRYARFMESRDRRVRREAFFALYRTYGRWVNTLSASLSAAVKRNIFYARARGYPSALAAALDEDNIPPAVYENVVHTVNSRREVLHRYLALRKRMLALEELHPYDLMVSLAPQVEFDIPYPETQQTLMEAFHPLGESYLRHVEKAFGEGWIDVYENRGKRSGAYSWSTYGVHPYILMNYNNTLNDLFTLAHELGHAMHSYFTNAAQPFHYSHYTTFVAEVASTFNEALLFDYLLRRTTDPRQKLYLLSQYVDQIRGTVFVQALFAEFEKTIHEQVERGQPLTVQSLNALNRELYQRYFGPELVIDPEYDVNWCRIPHFYYNFYVYQYVTGFSAATALAQKILAGDTAAREAYLEFLSRGNSDYSINLLRDAGVDMTSPEPIAATTELMASLLNEMEKL